MYSVVPRHTIQQEVFLKIHQHADQLREVKRLESWIYQITRNLIIDYYRSHRQPMTSLETEEALALPDNDIVSELLPCVQAMVLALPEHDRQANGDPSSHIQIT